MEPIKRSDVITIVLHAFNRAADIADSESLVHDDNDLLNTNRIAARKVSVILRKALAELDKDLELAATMEHLDITDDNDIMEATYLDSYGGDTEF